MQVGDEGKWQGNPVLGSMPGWLQGEDDEDDDVKDEVDDDDDDKNDDEMNVDVNEMKADDEGMCYDDMGEWGKECRGLGEEYEKGDGQGGMEQKEKKKGKKKERKKTG